MTRSIAMMLMFAACLSAGTPTTTNAQLGGLLKKKIKEAIKPPEKPAEAPPAPSSQAAPAAASAANEDEAPGLPRVQGDVLEISNESLSRLMRGMDAETAMLADFEKVLAKYPTREQYEQCTSKAMQTPEGQKAMAPLLNMPSNVTREQVQAITEKINADVITVQKKACPFDPNDWTDYKRSERMKRIHSKAASMARAKPLTSTYSPREIGQPALLFDVNPYDALPDTVNDTLLVIRGSGGFSDHQYEVLIERLVEYCGLKKEMDVSPRKGGVKAPGSGKDIYWVYTEAELITLKSFDCVAFAKKYKSVIAQYSQ